jgi:hypothetical protein
MYYGQMIGECWQHTKCNKNLCKVQSKVEHEFILILFKDYKVYKNLQVTNQKQIRNVIVAFVRIYFLESIAIISLELVSTKSSASSSESTQFE